MIITEVGLNHCGDIDYADEYIQALLAVPPDGLTFQIREVEFYQNKSGMNLILPDSYYQKIVPKIKKAGVKFGMAIADPDKIGFYDRLGTDFYKVIRSDINNYKLVGKLLDTGRHIFVSTGMAGMKEISAFVTNFKRYKSQITLIHTQLTHLLTEVNLKAIVSLKQKFNLPVAFGSHCLNINVLYLALGFEPSDMFFYVRGSRKDIHHGDEEHAIALSYYPEVIGNLRALPKALGIGSKKSMVNKIES